MVKYNFKHFDCVQFYAHSRNNKKLLSDVRSSVKYFVYVLILLTICNIYIF